MTKNKAISITILFITLFIAIAILKQPAYSDTFPPVFELSSLDSSNGFVINNIPGHVFDALGVSVSNAGDINNDGISDIIIGDPLGDPSGYDSIGYSYLVFGSSTGFDASLNVTELDGSNGLLINGLTNEYLGVSVSNAGDINADGIDDIIIGAPIASPNGKSKAGKAYVVFGTGTGFDANFDVTKLDGSNGFVINGDEVSDSAGSSVSGGGDINADGIADVVIGAMTGALGGTSREGKAYVVFGSSSGFSSTLELSDLNGSNGFALNGIDINDHTGHTVSIIGDVNGDNIDDFIIGAPTADPGGRSNAGKAYVVFGSSSGFSSTLELSDLNGSNGFALNGINAGDFLTGNDGAKASSAGAAGAAGDVNGDGIVDLVLGAFSASPNGLISAGQSYIVFGSRSGFSATLELSELDGSNGFVINGINAGDRSGYSVSGAGDINSDGIFDVVISTPSASPNGLISAGQSYVVFGSRSGFSATLELSELDGSNGFVINGINAYDFTGRAVSAAGDINSDGIDDFVIGAVGREGKCYVVFGKSSSVDTDNDGINDEVDLDPLVASYRFSDVPLGGTTSGQILNLDIGITVEITDAPNPDGVKVVVSGTGGVAKIRIDGSKGIYKLYPGEYIFTSGSVILEVSQDGGSATVEFTIGSTLVKVVVAAGGTARLEEITVGEELLNLIVTTLEGLEGTVTVNDMVIPPGESLTITSVSIDIKPDSDPNSMNLKSKEVIPVAILTTDIFDAITVDPLSVAFGPDGAVEAHGKGHYEDVDKDGDTDLVLHFKTQETGIQCGDIEAILTGETFDGYPIVGYDAVKTVGCK